MIQSDPIFKGVFGSSWKDLPTVMHKHYANRPYSDDLTVVEGELDVFCAGPIKLVAPIVRWLGQIPPYNEKGVPVTVRFESDHSGKAFTFDRIFHFKGSKPYRFRSRMIQIADNEVLEIMRFGLAWRLLYCWDGTKVVLRHKGYAWSLFGLILPLPLGLLLGKGYAEEWALDDETFVMFTHITHPWWGKVYEYKGRFVVKQAP